MFLRHETGCTTTNDDAWERCRMPEQLRLSGRDRAILLEKKLKGGIAVAMAEKEAERLSVCLEWRETQHKATVAAARTLNVHVHWQTPNTDDTEKCRFKQPSALFSWFFSFFFFFYTADTNIWTHSFNTRAKSLRDCFFFSFFFKVYIQMSFSCTTL